jgi:hypothetical protein
MASIGPPSMDSICSDPHQRLDGTHEVHESARYRVCEAGCGRATGQVPGRGKGKHKCHRDGEGGGHEREKYRLDEQHQSLVKHTRGRVCEPPHDVGGLAELGEERKNVKLGDQPAGEECELDEDRSEPAT